MCFLLFKQDVARSLQNVLGLFMHTHFYVHVLAGVPVCAHV
jgi:hypothetical protein